MVIAFIPLRAGSKSIPLKNIKPLCGKPLVYWNVAALQDSHFVDEIIIATDSDIIEETVMAFHFSKVKIYRRSSENASDTASTESVMLEYINKVNLDQDNIFMLVQATSPLTETKHFNEALDIYSKGKYDSIITCVRNYRFFWNADGTSRNYDYRNRPRRQNFDGMLMENGALYINSVKNILASKNRISGHIGIYEMPEHTANEIDEPDDWIVLENLMKKHVLSLQKNNQNKLKLFITDVDGVLTDGGMYYSEKGDELKKFNTRDGMAIQFLRNQGIKTAIITSEKTNIVENRAIKLKIDFLIQGKKNEGKLSATEALCVKMGISLNEVAYIGDDINCVEILKAVGIKACPSDACKEVLDIDGIRVMKRRGGDACVREFIETIL